jgi:hypothetical protein
LLVGRMSRSAIGTLLERIIRYLSLVDLLAGHRAEQAWSAHVASVASRPLSGPSPAVRSHLGLTLDAPSPAPT